MGLGTAEMHSEPSAATTRSSGGPARKMTGRPARCAGVVGQSASEATRAVGAGAAVGLGAGCCAVPLAVGLALGLGLVVVGVALEQAATQSGTKRAVTRRPHVMQPAYSAARTVPSLMHLHQALQTSS